MAKNFKALFIAFSILFSLSSCATFKPLKPSKPTPMVTGTFKAFYNKKSFEGFFSISKTKMRLDIVNSLGLSVYGIYATPKSVILKDYTTGKTYKNLKVGEQDLSVYKPLIVYTMEHFMNLCKANTERRILILSCSRVDNTILPSAVIFKDNQNKPLRLNLSNMKLIRSTQ